MSFIFWTILTLWILFVPIVRGCTNETTVSCSDIKSDTTVLRVFGINPKGICKMVEIGNRKFIYDPILINSEWITLVNTNGTCLFDVISHAKSIYSRSNEEIIILSLTPEYYRIILVSKGCNSTCQIIPFSTAFEDQLKLSNNTVLYPIYNDLDRFGPYCLNGGTIDLTYTGAGYKCICPDNISLKGQRCEYLDRMSTVRRNFFGVFKNATIIKVKFSLFSRDIVGTQGILYIRNASYQDVVEISISESIISLKVENTIITFTEITIQSQRWYDFTMEISQNYTTLMIDSVVKWQTIAMKPSTDFRAFYLVLAEVAVKRILCIKELMINSMTMDLIGPAYVSCCQDWCKCFANQSCYCNPIIAHIEQNCYCQNGAAKNNCQDNSEFYEMDYSSLKSKLIMIDKPLHKLFFQFRTLSRNGLLMKLFIDRPIYSLSLKIVDTNLVLVNHFEDSRKIDYNVSNGMIHSVTLNIQAYSLEFILDNNKNYSESIVDWLNENRFNFTPNLPYLTLEFGPMVKPYNSILNNLTTCFSTPKFNEMNDFQTYNLSNLGGEIRPGCSDGPKCAATTLNCSLNQVCKDDEWQNTKCICAPNFSVLNGTCVYNLCITNPCNNGTCNFNPSTNNFVCNCLGGFTGKNCEIVILKASLWWIGILLILLLLLLIIFIFMVRYFYLSHLRQPQSDITNVTENVVEYNTRAGESDYEGPPINFAILMTALNPPKNIIYGKSHVEIIPDFVNRKDEMERNNEDLILDHPLDYGYEGFNSENDSISSIGSKSDKEDLNFSNDIIDYIR